MIETGVRDLGMVDGSGFLSASWGGFGFDLFRNQDISGWRFSGGLTLDDGLRAGLSLRLFSGRDWTDSGLDIGLARAFGREVLAEFSIDTIVLSRDAGGRHLPGYRLGLSIGSQSAWFGFEPWVRILPDRDTPEAGTRFVCTPLEGLRLEAEWRYQDEEHRIGLGIGLGLGGLLARFHGEQRSDTTRYGVSLVAGDHRTGSLAGQGATCLEISVGGEMAETGRTANPLVGIAERPGFVRIVHAIRRAALDERVRAVIVHLRANGLGWARSEELMQALLVFRSKKIPVIASIEYADLKALLIASAADEIHIHPSAQVRTAGPGMVVTLYTGLLEKLGLQARLLYRSEYKTAAQTVTEKSMTPAHRQSAERVLEVIRNRAIRVIAANRAVPVTRVEEWVAAGLVTAKDAVARGMAAGNMAWDDLRRTVAGKGLSLVGPAVWLESERGFTKNKGIAIIHVEGTIVNGSGGLPQLPFGETSVGADSVVQALSRALADPAIRGIIVRVQSGGGDVLASERMRAALAQAAARKPLAVSMGDVAASGGYYLACGDGRTRIPIFAKAATLTGSIGVITGKLVTSGLRANLGVKTTRLGDTNVHLYGDEEDFTPAQVQLVTKVLDYWYDEFKNSVARGRGLTPAQVETHARGRVWAGSDALERGLVDHEGGAFEALLSISARAGLTLSETPLYEMNSRVAGLASLVTGGINLQMEGLLDAESWPGLFFSGRALALHPWSLRVE